MYRLFDGAVSCAVALPGIPLATAVEADLRVVLGQGGVNETDYDWFHCWQETDGELLLSCARRRGNRECMGYLLRFPELADFIVEGNNISCHPRPGCREESLRHLLLDQVIPRVWAHTGHLVLHASAVKLPDGRVIAFLGESGWGKSTLVAALQGADCQLISDDCIHLASCEEGVRLTPSYVGLRLNEDSIKALGMSGRDWTAVSHYSDKQRLAVAAAEDTADLLLDTLYVMAEPGSASTLLILALSGAALIPTLVKRSFLLDINDPHCAILQMREAGAVLRALPRVLSLDYPRDYHQLSALGQALVLAR